MKNIKQKESRWLMIPIVGCFSLAVVLKIDRGNEPMVFLNNPIEMENEAEYEAEKKSFTIEEKIKATFHEAPEVAVAIAKMESGKNLDPATKSTTDIMQDGRPFSIGLMQINLTWHTIAGIDCSKAFKGKNYKAVVTDEALYEKCVELASDPDNSLETARKIYNKYGFYAWGAFTNGSYKVNL